MELSNRCPKVIESDGAYRESPSVIRNPTEGQHVRRDDFSPTSHFTGRLSADISLLHSTCAKNSISYVVSRKTEHFAQATNIVSRRSFIGAINEGSSMSYQLVDPSDESIAIRSTQRARSPATSASLFGMECAY